MSLNEVWVLCDFNISELVLKGKKIKLTSFDEIKKYKNYTAYKVESFIKIEDDSIAFNDNKFKMYSQLRVYIEEVII